MKKFLINISIFILLIQATSCDDASGSNSGDLPDSSSTASSYTYLNPYGNDDLQILDEKRTLSRIKEIEVVKNEMGKEDIFIHALNGSVTSFYSSNSCEGDGPSYNIIASIPRLGIVFLDRVYGCHKGVTTIIVSIKDGISRELKSSIWKADQLSISPNGSWLVITESYCDIAFGSECYIEILDLNSSTNSLIDTKFFNDRVCAGNKINWFSENSFISETSIGENGDDCIYKPIKYEYVNNKWAFNFE
jgi:hypothetical protein